MKRIGINTSSIKRGENSDFGNSSHLLSEKERKDVQESIIDIYNIFKERVVQGRDKFNDINEIDEVALGRVWSGEKAQELGLVDINGDLYDAINLAKANASIPSSQEVDIIELPEVKEFSLIDLFSNNDDMNIEILNLKDIFPDELNQELEALEIIPVIMNDEIQFLMPYKIDIN
jgi:protease-4